MSLEGTLDTFTFPSLNPTLGIRSYSYQSKVKSYKIYNDFLGPTSRPNLLRLSPLWDLFVGVGTALLPQVEPDKEAQVLIRVVSGIA